MLGHGAIGQVAIGQLPTTASSPLQSFFDIPRSKSMAGDSWSSSIPVVQANKILFQAFDRPVISRKLSEWYGLSFGPQPLTVVLGNAFDKQSLLSAAAGTWWQSQIELPVVPPFLGDSFYPPVKVKASIQDPWAYFIISPFIAPPAGGGRRRPFQVEIEYLPVGRRKKKKVIRPIWDRPQEEARPAPRAPEFPPPFYQTPATGESLPAHVEAAQNVAGIPHPSPILAAANRQDAQDAQDALRVIGVMFEDDQEVGDALSALSAAGLI